MELLGWSHSLHCLTLKETDDYGGEKETHALCEEEQV